MKITTSGFLYKPVTYNSTTNQQPHRTYEAKDSVAFKSKLTFLNNDSNYEKEVIHREVRNDVLGYWFEIINSTIKNLCICNAVNRQGDYLEADSKIVDSVVEGDIEADGISPLIIEDSEVCGDVYTNEEGKKIVLSNHTTLKQDLLGSSKGHTEFEVSDGSVVMGNVVCGNFYERCTLPEVVVSNKSRIDGKIIMASDTGRITVDNAEVGEICFDALVTTTKINNPIVKIKNNGLIKGDVKFWNKRGRLIIETGSSVKGNIENADVTYVDKDGTALKEIAKD